MALGLVFSSVASAQTLAPDAASSTRPHATFRTGVDVVALNVTVLDQQQRLIGDLSRGDFAIFEDGVRQEIAYFETRDVPLDLALLIDTSISMRPNLDTVRRAALGLVALLRPSDRAAVMAFNDRVQVLTSFSADRDAIARAIAGAEPRGATALYDAVLVALREFRKILRHDPSAFDAAERAAQLA